MPRKPRRQPHHSLNRRGFRSRPLGGLEPLEARAMLTAGSLDATFGGTGLVSFHPGDPSGAVMANNMAIEPNGQIVQVGQATDPVTHNTDIAVVRYNASGTLDTTFGNGGVVLTPITSGSGAPTASSAVIDSQGRIVVAGGDGTHFELIRYTSSGQLDSTFGSGGLVSTTVPGTNGSGVASKVALDAAGNIIVGGSAFSSQLGFFAPLFRYSSNGTLDTTFGLNGMAFGDFPGVTISKVNSLLVEQDGSIVIGGNVNNNTTNWALLRFTPAGRPDPTFGSSGVVITTFGQNQETAEALTQQADGKILAVGASVGSSTGGFQVARYNPDGSLDTTFGSGGTLTTTFTGDHANALGVAVDANGKIVVGGTLTVNGQAGVYFGVARYLADGALDPTFGTAGLATTVGATQNDESNFDTEMALDPSGNIVLASTGANFNLARISGDPSVSGVPSLFSAGQSVQVQSSGAVPLVFTVQLSAVSNQQVTVAYNTVNGTALAGSDYSATSGILTFAPGVTSNTVTVLVNPNTVPEPNKSFVLALSSPSGAPLVNDQYSGVILTNLPLPPAPGSLDFTFGWAGFAQGHPGTSAAATANNVAVQSDDKVVEVGNVTDPATGASAFGIVRYNVDGTVDTTFGTGGTVSTPITTGKSAAAANSVLIQTNGDIVVVGGDGTNIVVARYLPNGTLDTSFGSQGIATTALPPADTTTGSGWGGQRAALDARGNIIVGGNGFSLNLGGFGAVIRLNSSGTQDLSFGQGGLALLKFSGGTAITSVDALIVQANQQIVVSGGVGSLDPHWLVGRLNSNGTIDTTFGSSGLVSTTFGGGNNGETAFGLAQQADGKLVVFGGAGAQTSGGFDLARYNTNGSLDTSFGTGGQVTTVFPNTTYSVGLNVAVLPTGTIIASGTSVNGLSPASASLAEYNANGTLDSSFGTAGLSIPHIGGVSEFDMTMAVAPSGKIVLASGGQVVPGGGPFDFNVSRYNTSTAPTISVASVTQPLAVTATTMTFHLTLSQVSGTPVTLAFQTMDSTAIAGQDYVAQSGIVTFAPGSTTATISIAIKGSLYANPDKSFLINLTNPSGAFADPSQVSGTIQNHNAATWFNPVNSLDVNGDGLVSPIDALTIINRLNSIGGGTLPAAPNGAHNFYDTNADGVCSPLDALQVINFLNAQAGPAVASPQVAAAAVSAVTVNAPVASSSIDSAVANAAVAASPTMPSGAAPSNDAALTDVAFALAPGAVPSTGTTVANAAAGSSQTTTSRLAAIQPSSGSSMPVSQTTPASSPRRQDDLGSNTDVEDLLDLLAQR